MKNHKNILKHIKKHEKYEIVVQRIKKYQNSSKYIKSKNISKHIKSIKSYKNISIRINNKLNYNEKKA